MTKPPIPFDEAVESMDRLTKSYTSKMAQLAEECVHRKQDAFIYGFLGGVAVTSVIGILLIWWRF